MSLAIPTFRCARSGAAAARGFGFPAPLFLALAFAIFLSAAAAPEIQAQNDGSEPYEGFGEASHYRKDFSGPTASGELYDPRLNTAAHATLPFGTRVRVTELRSGKTVVVHVNDRCPIVTGHVIDLSWEAAKELGILNKPGSEVTVTELAEQIANAHQPAQERPGGNGILRRLLPVSADAAQLPPAQTRQDPPPNAYGYGSRQPLVPAEDGQSQNQPILRVQFGAYANPRDAEGDIRRLRQLRIESALVQQSGSRWPYRLVTSGVFFDHSAASRWLAYIKDQANPHFQDAFVTR